MPEGPEVRVITDQLNKLFSKITLGCTGIEILGGRFLKKQEPSIIKFNKVLKESKRPAYIKGVYCKGKFIYFELSHLNLPVYFFSTLGMTGEWSKERNKHSSLALHLDSVGGSSTLYFNDIRHFGTFKVGTKKDLEKKLKKLGPDMLSAPCSFDEFKSKILMVGKNKTICQILMDQGIFSGIGNYIKCEALYRSGISPHRGCFSFKEGFYPIIEHDSTQFTEQELTLLYTAIQEIMQESYKMQGASLITYKTMDGSEGGFQNFLQVYGKEICPKGHRVRRETTADGRTTHWVPEVQK